MRRWMAMRGLGLVLLVGCGHFDFDRVAVRGDGGPGDADTDDAPDARVSPGWSGLAAGRDTTCGIYSGRAYCWGENHEFQLGDGTDERRAVPTQVALPAGTVTQIAPGDGHACAIVDGRAYCWGSHALGTSGVLYVPSPLQVGSLENVTAISAGRHFACAIANNVPLCWGDNLAGTLGDGDQTTESSQPVEVVGLPQVMFEGLEAAHDHAMLLASTGVVYAWGHNTEMLLFSQSLPQYVHTASALSDGLVEGVLPTLDGYHACALKNGRVTCWGIGDGGALGVGQELSTGQALVASGLDAGVTALASGSPSPGPSTSGGASCAVKNGELLCWGHNSSGRLGMGDDAKLAPVAVFGLPTDIVDVVMGHNHTCALSADGTLRCWGAGSSGQLGDGQSSDSILPVVVADPI